MIGVWQLTLSGTTLPEIACETAAGLLAAIAAVVARRSLGGRWLPNPLWLRWLPVIAVLIFADTARVLAFAARHAGEERADGDLEPVQLAWPWTTKSDWRVSAEAHRAFAGLAITCTPGSIMYDDEPDSHRLCVHSLVGGPPNLKETVAR
jgi:multisubunit Na+/H+ antiporter MnhE subunit